MVEKAPHEFAVVVGLAQGRTDPLAFPLAVLPAAVRRRRDFLTKGVWAAGAAVVGSGDPRGPLHRPDRPPRPPRTGPPGPGGRAQGRGAPGRDVPHGAGPRPGDGGEAPPARRTALPRGGPRPGLEGAGGQPRREPGGLPADRAAEDLPSRRYEFPFFREKRQREGERVRARCRRRGTAARRRRCGRGADLRPPAAPTRFTRSSWTAASRTAKGSWWTW